MTDFWSNHFNVHWKAQKVVQWMRVDYDVTIRKNSLGKFSDLLQDTAEHPAMLVYLDNFENQLKAPNENFAREVMELHTVGIGGGYTETDVQQASLLLTGWAGKGSGSDEATFEPDRHHVGPIKVMEFRTANSTASDGVQAQRAFYAYLAKLPATAQNICRKLAIRFVSDSPSSALVDRLAAVFLENDTAIAPVLRELFSSPEFASSVGLKDRRPLEFAIAALRSMGATYSDPDFKVAVNDLIGGLPSHQPFSWVTPDGFPDVASAWRPAGIALEQFNLVASLLTGKIQGFGLPAPDQLVAQSVDSSDGTVSALTQKWFGRASTTDERSAAQELLSANSLPSRFTSSAQQSAAATAIGLLLLHSPDHLAR